MNRWLSLLAVVALKANAVAASVLTFDDLRFWAGKGANRAVLAIDWDGDSLTREALVWGYRWDGEVTAEQMLRDVVAADPRLFAKISSFSGGLGRSVNGFGYDLNDDGAFALDDGTEFGPSGWVETPPSDDASAGADWYVEGWETGYWHYGVGRLDGEALAWVSSTVGMTSRSLRAGEWHGFAFAETLNYDEFAQNLVAALPPPIPGDFAADGLVDAADYTAWRDGLGGRYAVEDYTVWVANYGVPLPAASAPEPAGVLILGFLVSTSLILRRDSC